MTCFLSNRSITSSSELKRAFSCNLNSLELVVPEGSNLMFNSIWFESLSLAITNGLATKYLYIFMKSSQSGNPIMKFYGSNIVKSGSKFIPRHPKYPTQDQLCFINIALYTVCLYYSRFPPIYVSSFKYVTPKD